MTDQDQAATTQANTGGGTGQDPKMQPADLSAVTTKSGKTVADFTIPQGLLDGDHQLVDLVLRSEAMDDGERQYWFNLTEVMNDDQVEKLRGILTRERKKLAEIHAKYGKKPPVDPKVAAEMARKKAEERMRQREEIKAKEAAEQAKTGNADELLGDAWS